MLMTLFLHDIQEVKDFFTIFKAPYNDEDWKAFLSVKELIQERDHSEIRKCTENLIKRVIQPPINSLGLQIQKGPFYCNNHSMVVHCKGAEIIPGRKNYLNGYVPHFRFVASSEGISVKSGLIRESRFIEEIKEGNTWMLDILEDFLRVALEARGARVSPIDFVEDSYKSDGKGIYVGDIRHVPKLLENIKKLYKNIEGKKFDTMCDLKTGIRATSGKSEEILQRKYSSMLEDEVIDMLDFE